MHYRIVNNQTVGSIVIKAFLLSVSVFLKCVFFPILTPKQAPSLDKTRCPVLGVPFTLRYTETACLEMCSIQRVLKERPRPPPSFSLAPLPGCRPGYTFTADQFFKLVYPSSQ